MRRPILIGLMLTAPTALFLGCGNGSGDDESPASGGSTADGGAGMLGGRSSADGGKASVGGSGNTGGQAPSGGNSPNDGGASPGGGLGGGGDASGGGGAIPAEEHCTPGTTYGLELYPAGYLANCGVDAEDHDLRSIQLDEPIGPGDVYAFSADMYSTGSQKMELWGATEECGEPKELLAEDVMAAGVRCMEVRPAEGTYTNLIWIWYGGGNHNDVTMCPGGSCSE